MTRTTTDPELMVLGRLPQSSRWGAPVNADGACASMVYITASGGEPFREAAFVGPDRVAGGSQGADLAATKTPGPAGLKVAVAQEKIARWRDAIRRTPPAPSWIDLVLALDAEGKAGKAMTTLMFRFNDLIGAQDFAAVNLALRTMPVDRLSPSLLVGVLTVTALYRALLVARGEFFDRVRERLQADMPERWARVLVRLD